MLEGRIEPFARYVNGHSLLFPFDDGLAIALAIHGVESPDLTDRGAHGLDLLGEDASRSGMAGKYDVANLGILLLGNILGDILADPFDRFRQKNVHPARIGKNTHVRVDAAAGFGAQCRRNQHDLLSRGIDVLAQANVVQIPAPVLVNGREFTGLVPVKVQDNVDLVRKLKTQREEEPVALFPFGIT